MHLKVAPPNDQTNIAGFLIEFWNADQESIESTESILYMDRTLA